MPQMIIARNSRSDKDSVSGGTMGYFTGDVWVGPVLVGEGMSVANVNFAPCARTNWHYHGEVSCCASLQGRVGFVTREANLSGSMWEMSFGVPLGRRIGMVHQAVSHGNVEWYDAVPDAEFSKKR